MKTIISIKKIGFLFFIQLAIFSVSAQDISIAQKQAEEAYTKEDYNEAIELYEDILNKNGESSAVYYNLGNAYYKANKIAPAILNYERALLLAPADGDIRFNLQMAKQKAVDQIEPLDTFFVNKWFDRMQNLASVDTWATLALICFVLFIGCLILYFFSRKLLLKKSGFYAGIFLLVIVIAANIFAANQKKELKNRNTAIIFAPTVTVKSSPNESGTDLFILHEGTKVNIKSTLGEWNEIVLEDGNVGWMPSNKMVTI